MAGDEDELEVVIYKIDVEYQDLKVKSHMDCGIIQTKSMGDCLEKKP